MDKITAGFAMCGSFCTFDKAINQIEYLIEKGIEVIPIMSFNAYLTDTRFGNATDHIEKIEKTTQKKIISSIKNAEPIGPKKLLDVLIIEPCTGNTLAKLACGICDTSVTMAAKAHLRNGKPLVIAVSTNDALSTSANNIGKLMNSKNIFFVPMRQDDSTNKPCSVVADFEKTYDTMLNAMIGKQIQPILL